MQKWMNTKFLLTDDFKNKLEEGSVEDVLTDSTLLPN